MYNPVKPTKKKVLDLISTTWKTPYISVTPDTYSIFKTKIKGYEVDHTDGIGTKGFYHWQKRSFKNAVIDALAMNLNDLALVRAVPYKLQNHIVLPGDDNQAVYAIAKALATECVARKIAITGGETSIHEGSDSMDISITVSGFITKKNKNRFRTNDVLIGIKSNGLHSNGVTKIRELYGKSFKPEFIKPTRIYLDEILKVNTSNQINGMMHITGGAFTKLKDILINQDALIETKTLKPQKIFYEIYNKKVSDKDMYSIFNCGIGFVLSAPKNQAQNIIQKIPNSEIIGSVVKGNGKVIIKSSFSNQKIIL